MEGAEVCVFHEDMKHTIDSIVECNNSMKTDIATIKTNIDNIKNDISELKSGTSITIRDAIMVVLMILIGAKTYGVV